MVLGLSGAVAPDPGSPDFPALTALAFGLGATAFALGGGVDPERTQWYGFLGAFFGGAFGLLAYLFGLITNLY
jgi:hypothetical protein